MEQNKAKKLLFSVTMKDLEMQTFCVGGPGGGGGDTSNTAVRLIHKASGAVGVGKDHRSNHRNRIDAFKRLVETKEFKRWHKTECARRMNQPIIETEAEIKARVYKMIDDGLKNGQILVGEL